MDVLRRLGKPHLLSAGLLFLAFFMISRTTAESVAEVDLVLVLAMDVSSSVDASEYHLQNKGLARAFASPEVIALIQSCRLGRIAVMVVQWSGRGFQSTVVPWSIVSDKATADRVARAISAAPRRSAPDRSCDGIPSY